MMLHLGTAIPFVNFILFYFILYLETRDNIFKLSCDCVRPASSDNTEAQSL
jgi:hypothetical protein